MWVLEIWTQVLTAGILPTELSSQSFVGSLLVLKKGLLHSWLALNSLGFVFLVLHQWSLKHVLDSVLNTTRLFFVSVHSVIQMLFFYYKYVQICGRYTVIATFFHSFSFVSSSLNYLFLLHISTFLCVSIRIYKNYFLCTASSIGYFLYIHMCFCLPHLLVLGSDTFLE